MNKAFKKIISLFLAAVMITAVFPLGGVSAEDSEVPEGYTGIYTVDDLDNIRNGLDGNYILMNDIDMTEATSTGGSYDNGYGWTPIGDSTECNESETADFAVGDTFEFGSYPQSKVTDETIINGIKSVESNYQWVDYGYYAGTGDGFDGNMMPSDDIMYYKDISYNGNMYRAVLIKNYRPYYTGCTSSTSYTYQYDNGYTTGNIYYFKYEPIKWRVLNPETGLVFAETILDSQAFNNYVLKDETAYWGDPEKKYYADSYENSSIRQWLNNDFYNTVFSARQQNIIQSTELDNSPYPTVNSSPDSPSATDTIFLLSYSDVINSNYGFSTSKISSSTRIAQGSDYAKCQGLFVSTNDKCVGNSVWWLRTAGIEVITNRVCTAIDDGTITNEFYSYWTSFGVRPAMSLDLSRLDSYDKETKYEVGDIIEFGSYPQSKVTDETIINGIKSVESNYQWVDYGYYAGTGDGFDGNMMPSDDIMYYKDISYGGNIYRAVWIKNYRPGSTGNTLSDSNTYQDDNGYTKGSVYYFKYEPLTWRVLDPDEGYVMCTKAIDSQAYQNFLYYNESQYYNSKSCTNYASDWATSSIREWLNNDFFITAFSDTEKSEIGTTYNENKSYYFSNYDSTDTFDKIFLLSYRDILNRSYEFSSNNLEYDTARHIKSTDYAQCQGCYTSTDTSYDGNSWWRLRTPTSSLCSADVRRDGSASYYGMDVNCVSLGVVPAFKFNPHVTECEHNFNSEVTKQPTCTTEGTRTYTCSECEDTYEESIPALDHDWESDYTVDVKPTCQSTGSKSIHCSRCEATKDEQVITKAAHTIVTDVRVEPTCTKTGLTEGSHCSVCNEIIAAQEVLPALGHNYVSSVVEPNCIERGYTEHKCSRCTDTYIDSYTDFSAHNFESGKCTVCGKDEIWEYTTESGTVTITAYKGSEKSLEIPAEIDECPVIAIAEGAFANNTTLQYVSIPNSVFIIGKDAFKGCTSLKEVSISDSVSTISNGAFSDCTSLAIVFIASTNTTLKGAFSNNDSRLKFIVQESTATSANIAEEGLPFSTYTYPKEKDGKSAIAVKGTVTLYDDLDYNYWGKLVKKFPYAFYLYFDTLIFEGVEKDEIILTEDMNIDENSNTLTMNNVYISLNVDEKCITFRDLIELLEDGNLDVVITFDKADGTTKSFIEKVGDFFEDVFNALSKAINSIVKIFKKKK